MYFEEKSKTEIYFWSVGMTVEAIKGFIKKILEILVSIETKRDSINGFIGDYLITSFAGEENVFLIVDSSIKIPKFDGNDFFDVFDNGFGFLPIKGVKETISPVAGHGKITWTISLLSKKSSLVNISLFNIE
jgi:hypothetical protein